jgi:hypothetical protein
VEAGPELDFLDQGPGPEGFVAGALGFVAEAGGFLGGLFEFLLVDEPFDALAGGLVRGFLLAPGEPRRRENKSEGYN